MGYFKFTSIGLSVKQDSLFTWWPSTGSLGLKVNTIGNFSGSGVSLILNNLNSNTRNTREQVDRQHNNGETIKISKTDTFIEFSRTGKTYHRYVFKSGDRKDLYPAIDIYNAGDEYI